MNSICDVRNIVGVLSAFYYYLNKENFFNIILARFL